MAAASAALLGYAAPSSTDVLIGVGVVLCLLGFVIVAVAAFSRVGLVGVLFMGFCETKDGVLPLYLVPESFMKALVIGEVLVVAAFSISSMDFRTGLVMPEGPAFGPSGYLTPVSFTSLYGGVLNIFRGLVSGKINVVLVVVLA